MGFTISHKILFELNVWHYYFLNKGNTLYNEMDSEGKIKMLSRYDVHRIFDITPTPSCLRELKKHRLIWKKTPTGFLVAVKKNEAGTSPFIPLDSKAKFTFVLSIIDPEFFNYSDLLLTGNKGKIYYFNNIPGSTHKTNLALKEPHKIDKSYIDPDYRIDLISPLLNISNLPIKVHFEAKLFDLSSDTDSPFFTKNFETGDKIESPIQLDFRRISSGWYRLQIFKTDKPDQAIDERTFYLNNDRIQPGAFALVEVFSKQADAPYALLRLDGNFQLEEKGIDPGKEIPGKFELRIKNRQTKWKYIFSKEDNLEILLDSKPLTRSGYIRVERNGKKLPNPSAKIIKEEKGEYISEIFM